jgi:hypothetical protein
MIEFDSLDGWPSRTYRIANVAEVHAFGQVTLAYNFLEETVGMIFAHYLPTEKTFSEAIFHKLNNPDRMLLLSELIERNESDPAVTTALSHFLRCYDICNENRNILAHAIIEARAHRLPNFIPVSKRSKDAKVGRVFFHFSLSDLRGIADSIAEVFNYGTRLRIWLAYRSDPKPETAKLMVWPAPPQRPPLPEKPQKPRKLPPFPPPA